MENPQLELARANRIIKFGCFPYHFTTLSDKYIHLAISHLLQLYQHKAFSIFGSNFHRALKIVTGLGFCRSEPISLSGYTFDFEVLLDAYNKPIRIPHSWNYTRLTNVLKSIGLGKVDDEKSFVERDSTLSVLLSGLKESEQISDASNCNVATVVSDALNGQSFSRHINLASDWGRYFTPHQTLARVARNVVLEANGPGHYAVNDHKHLLGDDVVMKRQLEALGWEVIHVSPLDTLGTSDFVLLSSLQRLK